MAEEKPSLHIDTDWKKQAQEEKRRLAEEQAKKAQAQQAAAGAPAAPSAAPPAAAAPATSPARPSAGAGAGGRMRERGQAPQPSFAALVQSLLTQVLFYLGDLAPRGTEPQINLDMAKYNIDVLGILEEKTKSNLSEEEQRLLDSALYEVRMRYVSVASQYATV
ncbi:MAG TPA: DUF1844 domain-containing protein [Tepidisphaeraceae bacterium]|jgi:hypothetical protein